MLSKKTQKQKNNVIVILGGLMRKKPDGNWKTGDFNYLRVLAGYYLYKDIIKNEAVKLIVSGGKGIYEKIPNAPAVATVMKQELIKLGLSAKKIVEENKTASTYQELVWLKNLLNKNPGRVFVISNNYHLPRIRTMINILPDLKSLKQKLILVSAEKISVKHDKKLKDKIKAMTRDPRMKKTILIEKSGVKALITGRYKLK